MQVFESLINAGKVAGAVAAILGVLAVLFRWLRALRAEAEARALAGRQGLRFHPSTDVFTATQYYVPPSWCDTDPDTMKEPSEAVANKVSVLKRLDKILSDAADQRYLIVLAGSGMGKTSLLINYSVRNQHRWRWRRERMELVPLRDAEAGEYIESIENPRDTVLLLDAFDEDEQAISGDHTRRILELLQQCQRFKRVVITCRTQFFTKAEEIPDQSGVMRLGVTAENKGYALHKLYLAPLDDARVWRFVRRRYSLFEWRKRRKARRIVQRAPQLTVRPLLLAKHPVTNAQYARFLQANPKLGKPAFWDDPKFNQPQQPVVGVSWDEARQYCEWAGLTLPTEAQWEYACRAGTTTPFSFGENITPAQVNYDGNYPYAGGKKGQYRQGTVLVGSLPPNPGGLHEMHGNVWEWCQDWYVPYEDNPPRSGDGLRGIQGASYRVRRGGSWVSYAQLCRSAYRGRYEPGLRNHHVGFRPARVIT